MSDLHTALEAIGPIDFSDVPVDNLEKYMRHAFEAGELICNSVPPPPGGTDFSSASVAHSKVDSASSAQEITASDARPPAAHPEHADLQKSWGKPIKLSAKENSLGFYVYKMAGKDRHGAWFARRSVHEGLSFTKFQRAMQREFAESLTVQGGPGAGSVRGIGGDRRLEKKKVEGVGQMEVFQLSAQFPGPTTPREFITLLLTGENALTHKSSDQSNNKGHIPRHYMIISKPVTHPDTPARNGYIRGQYESVEMIRELPIHPAPAQGDKSGLMKHDLNPVEWIMITRSDPGGGIPRFMVDRGTPSSICADAVKFFDWACGKDEIPDPDADEDQQNKASEKSVDHSSLPPGGAAAGTAGPQPQPQAQPAQGGIFATLTNALEAGMDAYAPTAVANYAHAYLDPNSVVDEDSSSSSDDSSSFASAQDFQDSQPAVNKSAAAASTDTLGLGSRQSADSGAESVVAPGSHEDKGLQKLERQREKLEVKLAKKREAEDGKLQSQKEKDKVDLNKAAEKHEKELKKIEEKRQKEMAKLEAKKEKELQKAEKKRQKQLDRESVSQVSRERDEFVHQLDAVKRENGLLKQQAADLQRENAILVERLSKLGGPDALKAIKRDVESGR